MLMQLPFHFSSPAFCRLPTSSLPFKLSSKISLDIISLFAAIYLMGCFDICFSILHPEPEQAETVCCLLGPALVSLCTGSIPCSSSSGIRRAFRPALALPRSFNPSSSGSAAIKEAHFTRARYRSVSHRTCCSLSLSSKGF